MSGTVTSPSPLRSGWTCLSVAGTMRTASPSNVQVPARWIISAMRRLSDAELPGHQHPLDLARPFADLKDLGVAPHAGHRIFVHEAVAAVDLRGLAGVGDRDLRGVQLRQRRLL